MEVKGLCSYCSKPAILYTCTLCGALVCGKHYNMETKVCSGCSGRRV